MADAQGNKQAKEYHLDIPVENRGFHVKGLNDASWGMKNRLSRIFSPVSGNTVMLAFDHGYIMGPTSGLERLDIAIPPLLPYIDVLMATKGALRTSINPITNKGICLRANHDTSVLFDDMSVGSGLATDMEDALRLNVDCLAMQCFVGAKGESSSLQNLCKAINMGEKYGVPVMAVTAVGKEMERTNQYFQLATRILAELGAHTIKTYYCEDFEKVIAACPVPIVVAGGKKTSEAVALEMAYKSMASGARGMDMGRNIFQSECPEAMGAAISKVVHEKYTGKLAYEFYLDMKNTLEKK